MLTVWMVLWSLFIFQYYWFIAQLFLFSAIYIWQMNMYYLEAQSSCLNLNTSKLSLGIGHFTCGCGGASAMMRVSHIWQMTHMTYFQKNMQWGQSFGFGRNTFDSASLAAGHFTCGGPVTNQCSGAPLVQRAFSIQCCVRLLPQRYTTQNVPPLGHCPTAAFFG